MTVHRVESDPGGWLVLPSLPSCPECEGSPDWPCATCGRPDFGGNVGTVPVEWVEWRDPDSVRVRRRVIDSLPVNADHIRALAEITELVAELPEPVPVLLRLDDPEWLPEAAEVQP